MSTLAPPSAPSPIDYPDSDGLPMAENTLQYQWITTIVTDLRHLFADNPAIFVAGDLFWYPVQGNGDLRMAPDAMVAFGRPKGDRGSYRQWEEGGVAPQVVFEVLSPGNRAGGMREKLDFYDQYGAEEYYIYDPDRVVLLGYLRKQGRLAAIEPMNGHVSPRLRIRFEMSEGGLTIFRPDGKPFITPEEHAEREEQQQQRAERAEERAGRAEERAGRAEERAKQAQDLAKEQRDRADRLQQELDRLRRTSSPADPGNL